MTPEPNLLIYTSWKASCSVKSALRILMALLNAHFKFSFNCDGWHSVFRVMSWIAYREIYIPGFTHEFWIKLPGCRGSPSPCCNYHHHLPSKKKPAGLAAITANSSPQIWTLRVHASRGLDEGF
ncbi:hypothetical protein NPIL_525931 [Nephila pilipes]|uniref:Uncharacterized protein n=1 Tax=Nephila pilipes TaxID=299642 RepID=A0A8X6Q2B2_NEPPI|nr:hypothetical protein NPIL_525931 [Nephila pilipes]